MANQHTPSPGSRVRLVRVDGCPLPVGVDAVVSRVCDNGWEVEVVHQDDGGGFDFWPINDIKTVKEIA